MEQKSSLGNDEDPLRRKSMDLLKSLSREIRMTLSNNSIFSTESTWTYGLFDCFGDCRACLYATCCPICAAQEIYGKIGLEAWINGCMCCWFCAPCAACKFTERFRAIKDIEGSREQDRLNNCCCCPCQRVRELREARQCVRSTLTSQRTFEATSSNSNVADSKTKSEQDPAEEVEDVTKNTEN